MHPWVRRHLPRLVTCSPRQEDAIWGCYMLLRCGRMYLSSFENDDTEHVGHVTHYIICSIFELADMFGGFCAMRRPLGLVLVLFVLRMQRS